jgi:hypothetical protein
MHLHPSSSQITDTAYKVIDGLTELMEISPEYFYIDSMPDLVTRMITPTHSRVKTIMHEGSFTVNFPKQISHITQQAEKFSLKTNEIMASANDFQP